MLPNLCKGRSCSINKFTVLSKLCHIYLQECIITSRYSGNIGGTAAKLFLNAGHEIAVSNSKGRQSLQLFVESLGPCAKAMTVEDTIAFGDVKLLVLP
jgi:NADP oxidoreductase coenzyme F420-dependent